MPSRLTLLGMPSSPRSRTWGLGVSRRLQRAHNPGKEATRVALALIEQCYYHTEGEAYEAAILCSYDHHPGPREAGPCEG
jgi:hypothetical protein